MKGKHPNWYISDAPAHEDDLLDAKEDLLDKIRSFMGGAQRGIYDDARNTILRDGANIDYVDPDALPKLRAVLNDPNCFKGNAIQTLKNDLFDLKNKVDLKVIEERKTVLAELATVADTIAQLPEFHGLEADQKARITARIDRHKAGLETTTLIPTLRDKANTARTQLLPELVTEASRLAQPAPQPQPAIPRGDFNDPPAPAPRPQPAATVVAASLKVHKPKTILSDEADVDQYLTEVKKTLLAEIQAGKKVIV